MIVIKHMNSGDQLTVSSEPTDFGGIIADEKFEVK